MSISKSHCDSLFIPNTFTSFKKVVLANSFQNENKKPYLFYCLILEEKHMNLCQWVFFMLKGETYLNFLMFT